MVKKVCLLILIALLFGVGGCTISKNWVIWPKAPYPYDAHREGKTTQYYLYHIHYQGPSH